MVDADPVESSSFPLVMDPLDPNKNNDTVTPEDLKWLDSCLVKISDTSDSEWMSFKEALTEVQNLSPEPPFSFELEHETDDHRSLTDGMSFLSSEKIESALRSIENNDPYSSIEEDDEEGRQDGDDNDIKDIIQRIRWEKLKIKNGLEDVARPTHSEFGGSDNTFSGLGLGSPLSEEEVEPSVSEIFNVWNVGFSEEVDEFVKQINEEFEGDAPWSKFLTSGESEAWKNLANESLDELVSGLSDLSLSQK